MNTNRDTDGVWDSDEPAMQEVLNAARIIAASGVTTLITGESGVGKAHLARAIHDASPRHAAAYVSMNCAALPSEHAEELLFGTAGTADAAPGYLPSAHLGTLFLDDIGELAPDAQARLMHFLVNGEVIPGDGSPPRRLDVRLIAASQDDLDTRVAAGLFRKDLFYRLQVVPLTLPPLRDRPRDIALLGKRFLDELAATHKVSPATLGRQALQVLEAYPWPGNVHELRNLCERLTLLVPGRVLAATNLPAEFRGTPTPECRRLVDLPSTGLVLEELEKDLIAQALERTGGNRSRAARLLGLTRDTLLYRLKKFAMR